MTLVRAKGRLTDTLSLYKYLSCVLFYLLIINKIYILHPYSDKSIILGAWGNFYLP
jgi:hypothetical protein